MFHDLRLPHPDLKLMAANGLTLGGLSNTRRLNAASRFEGPTSIQSTVAPGALLDIGAFCNLSGGQINNLRAGRYCSIADGVSIGTHEHPTDWLTTSRTSYYPEVNGWSQLMLGEAAKGLGRRIPVFSGSCPVTTLGPDVWIGQGAFLKSGVTVGAGAIIGARATVIRDVPPYAIVVGTPARVVRLRFPEALVERLLASEWWQYSVYDLFDAPLNDPAATLDQIEAWRAEGRLHPYSGPVFGPADLDDPAAISERLSAAVRSHPTRPADGPDRAAPIPSNPAAVASA